RRAEADVVDDQRVLDEVADLDDVLRGDLFQADVGHVAAVGDRIGDQGARRHAGVDVAGGQLRAIGHGQDAVEGGRRGRRAHALDRGGEHAAVGGGFLQAQGFGIADRSGDVDVDVLADGRVQVAVAIG